MFDILHHYQLPLPRPRESYLSLADVPLSVMNFLYPPPPDNTSSPPYLSPYLSSPAQGLQQRGKKEEWGGWGRGDEIKKKKGGEVIDARVTLNKMANII